jgi:hypothetical protein
MAPSKRRRLVFLALCSATAALLVACAGIVGLDQFQKGECPGARCEGGSTDVFGPDVINPDAPDTGNGDAGPGVAPASWAQWVMPNYEAGTVDVENAPHYTAGAGFVHDDVTGLTWLQPTPNNPSLSYDDAVTFCASLTMPAGPWRLPTRIELVTLLDFGRDSGSLIGSAFPGTSSGKHWTASADRDVGGNPAPSGSRLLWTVDFQSGAVTLQPEANNVYAVKCVKGGR